MLRAFISAYPWDLIDEELGVVLDRLQGEVGVTGVSVWVGCPPITQLRVRAVEPRVFRTRGGLFVQPSGEHYVATRLKPIVSGWLKGRDPLARIADACLKRSLELRAIISAAATGRLAQRHSEMTCKNVFGAESQISLCLSSPDVQTYLCSLVADVSSQYPLAGLSVTDFVIAWFEALSGELHSAVPLGETEASLLATCFCESCHQRAAAAGVDVTMAQRSVQMILQKSFDDGSATDQRLDALPADNEPLAAFDRWRAAELSLLLKRLADACRCELLLDRGFDDPQAEQQGQLDLAVPVAVITQLRVPDQLASALCPSARRSELRVPESFAIGPHGPELVTMLSQAAELGFAGVEFDNYGLLPDAALTNIKQAIRFARRTTNE